MNSNIRCERCSNCETLQQELDASDRIIESLNFINSKLTRESVQFNKIKSIIKNG